MWLAAVLGLAVIVVAVHAQTPMTQDPAPNYADLDYAPPDPPGSNGHRLDLYFPARASAPLPLVIWTSGSAWMADTGKRLAGALAARLNPAGYAKRK
jgi:hypothetical protein